MIIGNNNNGNTFNNNGDNLNNNLNKGTNYVDNNQQKSYNPFIKDINSMQHSDPTSKNEMRDKSLAMLQNRLENGLITLDDFNKKVKNINNSK